MGHPLPPPPRLNFSSCSLFLFVTSAMSRPSEGVQLLLLGSGWTGNFLLPLLDAQGISYAYTSRTGTRHRHAAQDPITFSTATDEGEGASSSITGLNALPSADNIVVVFPLRSPESVTRLVEAYESAHPGGSARWIALGSSGAWGKGVHTSASPPSTPMSPRAESEAALLALDSSSSSSSSSNRRTAVLNLTGLYDDEIRLPANFAKRVGDSKDKLAGKTSLHLIHGRDLARAVVALAQSSSTAAVWGKRWIVSGESRGGPNMEREERMRELRFDSLFHSLYARRHARLRLVAARDDARRAATEGRRRARRRVGQGADGGARHPIAAPSSLGPGQRVTTLSRPCPEQRRLLARHRPSPERGTVRRTELIEAKKVFDMKMQLQESCHLFHRHSAVLVEDFDDVGAVQGGSRGEDAPIDCLAILENAPSSGHKDNGRGHIARFWTADLDGCRGA